MTEYEEYEYVPDENDYVEQLRKRAGESGAFFTSSPSITRSTIGRIIQVTTQPVLLYRSNQPSVVLITNPTTSLGFSPAGSLIATGTTISSDGNTQNTVIGVANYNSAQFVLSVTAISGKPIVDFYVQAQDPISLLWVDTQIAFSSIGNTGRYYANIGGFGLTTRLAVRWNFLIAGNLTLGLSYILKDGVGGTSVGTSQTVYLGSDGVTIDSGYPLLENKEKIFEFSDRGDLYGVAETNVNIRVLEIR